MSSSLNDIFSQVQAPPQNFPPFDANAVAQGNPIPPLGGVQNTTPNFRNPQVQGPGGELIHRLPAQVRQIFEDQPNINQPMTGFPSPGGMPQIFR